MGEDLTSRPAKPGGTLEAHTSSAVVLVTGVAGFIGANLAEEMLGRGYRVVGLDNLSYGSEANLAAFRGHPAFSFHRGDVRDAGLVASLVDASDAVVHLAAFKIPRYGNALETLHVNTHGTRTVLAAAATRQRRVVLASTSDVYGRNPEVPFHEGSDLWFGPSGVKRWSYAVSKIWDEHLGFAYREQHGLPVVIVRFFGGYGPRQSMSWWGGPQGVFIEAALRDEPMEIHGDGRQTRSFTYVKDHVDGLIQCLERPEAVGEVFNLGDDREITIMDLASLVWSLAGRGEPKYRMVSYRTFGKYEDVRRRVPDASKAARLLGFIPATMLEEGLARTIAWRRSLDGEAA